MAIGKRSSILAVLVTLAFLLPGCGSHSSGTLATGSINPPDLPKPTNINVYIGTDGGSGIPFNLQLDIQALELQARGAGQPWKPVPPSAGSIVQLNGGAPTLFAQGVPWTPDLLNGIRVTFGPHCTLSGPGSPGPHPLTAPSIWHEVTQPSSSVEPKAGQTTDIVVLLETGAAIQEKAAQPGSYLMRPARLWMVDKADTRTLTGKVTDPAGAGLPGVAVMAQNLEQRYVNGATIPMRTTRTAADGTYTLDLCPRDTGLCVTAQPVAGSAVYGFRTGKVSTQNNADAQVDIVCPPVAAAGTVHATVAEAITADQADRVDLCRQPMKSLGNWKPNLLVRTAFATAASPRQVTFEAVPPGDYFLLRTRYSRDAQGMTRREWHASTRFQVLPGATINRAVP